MIVCAVTDRRSLGEDLQPFIARALAAGVDYVQIREKDLTGRELYESARSARAAPNPRGGRLLINERLDIALAAGLDGVHLPSDAPPVDQARRAAPDGFLIGVSCHGLDDLRRAAREGADYAVFGPVFDTPSKRRFGAPQGLDRLAAACRESAIPVLAIGGVTLENARDCLAAGAAGVAAISLFQRPDLEFIVARLRESGRTTE